mgnify:CR=1 FL=1
MKPPPPPSPPSLGPAPLLRFHDLLPTVRSDERACGCCIRWNGPSLAEGTTPSPGCMHLRTPSYAIQLSWAIGSDTSPVASRPRSSLLRVRAASRTLAASCGPSRSAMAMGPKTRRSHVPERTLCAHKARVRGRRVVRRSEARCRAARNGCTKTRAVRGARPHTSGAERRMYRKFAHASEPSSRIIVTTEQRASAALARMAVSREGSRGHVTRTRLSGMLGASVVCAPAAGSPKATGAPVGVAWLCARRAALSG